MSLRAEILRLALRVAVKRRITPGTPLADIRARVRITQWLMPMPPADITTTTMDFGGITTDRIVTPNTVAGRAILFLHGGAYLIGSPALYRDLTWRLADAARATLFCPDYRLAPEHRFPAALDDCVGTWRGLLDAGVDPARAAIAGDSAGGGLTLGVLLRLRDLKLPMPAAAVLMSPWTDLALTGNSLIRHARRDPVIPTRAMPVAIAHYLGDTDRRDPYASPVFAELSGLPAMLIQVGSDEALFDDASRIADGVRAAGGDVEFKVWPRMPHVWQLAAKFVPEARAAIAQIGAYLDARLNA